MQTKNPYTLILVFSSICMIIAYFVEYIMQVAVCPLCIYQRFPYLILVVIAITALAKKNCDLYNKGLIITLISAIILSSYHVGVERGIFKISRICKPVISISKNISIHDLKQLLYNQKTVMCNKPGLVVFNLSMTEWNLLLNIIVLIYFVTHRKVSDNKTQGS